VVQTAFFPGLGPESSGSELGGLFDERVCICEAVRQGGSEMGFRLRLWHITWLTNDREKKKLLLEPYPHYAWSL
jgi:hypothetical protein